MNNPNSTDKPAAQPALAASACSAACATRISHAPDGKAFVVYLRDGTKIIVGRDRTTKGPAWLEVSKQAQIKAATAAAVPVDRSEVFFSSDVSEAVDYVLDFAAQHDQPTFIGAVMKALKPWRDETPNDRDQPRLTEI